MGDTLGPNDLLRKWDKLTHRNRNRTLRDYDVLPLQPAWPQTQSTSGVFSMAAHSVLQYLPVVAMHEQTGCAHFSVLIGVISFLLVLDQHRVILKAF